MDKGPISWSSSLLYSLRSLRKRKVWKGCFKWHARVRAQLAEQGSLRQNGDSHQLLRGRVKKNKTLSAQPGLWVLADTSAMEQTLQPLDWLAPALPINTMLTVTLTAKMLMKMKWKIQDATWVTCPELLLTSKTTSYCSAKIKWRTETTWGHIVAQFVKLLLTMPTFQSQLLHFWYCSLLSRLGKPWKMAQLLENLPSPWEILTELLTPGFGLRPPVTVVRKVTKWSLSLPL